MESTPSHSSQVCRPNYTTKITKRPRSKNCIGDGVGAEVSESVKEIFKADNVPVEWEQVDVSGVETGNKHSEELFRESIASLKRNKLGLKGIVYL